MNLIKEFMKIGGAKTPEELLKMYPTEEAFFMKHGGAISKLMAAGGEAYPQTSTMDNFFTYGVPVPPTYYAHGGAFPMAQSEEQFFSPFYGNVPNPYNKAMGGSSEAYPQSMSFPYGATGRSTHFMMADGGYTADEEQLPKMGVDGRLSNFVGIVKNTATGKLNSNLAENGLVLNPEQYAFQSKYGGNLKTYQSQTTGAVPKFDLSKATVSPAPPMDPKQAYEFYTQSSPAANQFSDKTVSYNDANSDKGTSGAGVVNNYYYEYGQQGPGNQQITDLTQRPPEYYNDIDYLFGRRRPLSDFNIRGRGIAGNYRSTGWLKDEYGMDRLRQLGLTGLEETKGGLFKRPTKKYYFGQQGQGMGYTPGTVDQQGMPVNTPAAQTPGQPTPGATPQDDQQAPKRPRRNFFGRSDEDSRWTPEDTGSFFSSKVKNVEFPMGESTFETEGYKDFNRNADFKNWKATQKLNKLGERLDRNYQREEGLKKLYGTEMSSRDERLRNRDTRRYNRIAEKFDRDQYTQPAFAYGGYTTYAKGGSYNTGDVVDMTPEELQRFIEMGGQVEFLD